MTASMQTLDSQHSTPDSSPTRRGAILTMELVLVLPVFLTLLFAVVEFSLLTSARMRIADAARVGVRRVCLSSASVESVKADVAEILGPGLSHNASIHVSSPTRSGGLANVRVVVPMSNVTPDLLWAVGFSVDGRVLVADAPMVREHDTVSVDQRGQEQL